MKRTSIAMAVVVASIVAAPLPASAASSSDEFSIVTLGTTNMRAVDTNIPAGDDGGYTAITSTHVLQSGDTALVRYTHALAAPTDAPNNCSAVAINWASSCPSMEPPVASLLISDIATETAYLFDAELVGGMIAFNGLIPLNNDGTRPDPAAPGIEFSAAVTVPDGRATPCTITASGWSRIVIWDQCTGDVFDIALPSGTVTALQGATREDFTVRPREDTEASSPVRLSARGVAEEIDGQLTLALVTDPRNEIHRYAVTAETPSSTLLFSLGASTDVYSFAVSPQANMWCFHSESGSPYSVTESMSEPLVCAEASFTVPAVEEPVEEEPTPAPTPEPSPTTEPSPQPSVEAARPELAETGSDALSVLPLAMLALVLGGAALMVGRRADRARVQR